MSVFEALTDEDIQSCFEVMKELRPEIESASFVGRIREQESQGYHLLGIRDGARVVAAAGYRIGTFLAWGRVLYVDDLITHPDTRGRGFGSALLRWLIDQARRAHCAQLHLDSGYQRLAAHRFYLNHGLHLHCHHFAMKLDGTQAPR